MQVYVFADWVDNGWRLSPAYDLNPIPYAQGLHLNITNSDNRLDFSLAFEVASFFQLTPKHANEIYQDIIESVKHWQTVATEIGISRAEQERMQGEFRLQ